MKSLAEYRIGGRRPLSEDEKRNAETVLATYAAFAGRWVEAEQRAHYTDDFRDHSRLHGATFTELVAFMKGFRENFPNGSVVVDELFVDGNYVITKVTGRLSDDHPPDDAMEIYRMVDGKIAEHWDVLSPNPDFNDA